MRHHEFRTGAIFKCGDKDWRCTDIGKRVIVAICLSDRELVTHDPATGAETTSVSADPRDFNGPPYGVAESVFDENDMPGCEPVTPIKTHEEEMAELEERMFFRHYNPEFDCYTFPPNPGWEDLARELRKKEGR